MDDKVRRGLGQLALAALGAIVAVLGVLIGDNQVGEGLALGGLILCLVMLISGLVNIAMGLLRPDESTET